MLMLSANEIMIKMSKFHKIIPSFKCLYANYDVLHICSDKDVPFLTYNIYSSRKHVSNAKEKLKLDKASTIQNFTITSCRKMFHTDNHLASPANEDAMMNFGHSVIYSPHIT